MSTWLNLFVTPGILPVDSDEFSKALERITNENWDENGDLCYAIEFRWDNCIDDLKQLSSSFPDSKIEVYFEGDSPDELGSAYAFGGNAIECGANVHYEPNTLWPAENSDIVWVVAFSYDWEDNSVRFTTRSDLETWVREQFEIPEEIEAWTQDFHKKFLASYNESDWKSFQIIEVSLYDGAIKPFPIYQVKP